MKISYHVYELELVRPFNGSSSRQGALLKVHFSDGLIGYADCHPWKEFSDVPLEKQLALLKAGKTTPLTKKSLYFAELDAKARSSKVNLLQNLKIPPSNYLMDDFTVVQEKLLQRMEEGFTTFKVKIGNDLEKELLFLKEQIPPKAILRLDFNLKLSKDSFKAIIDKLQNLNIEYIEDPFTFDERLWEEIQAKDGLNLACDFEQAKAINKFKSAKVLIVKPAITEDFHADNQKVVVTSYLDHPFGQCTAAYVAAKYPDTTCGLLTHHFYKKNDFSEELTTKGPEFKIPHGTGFGFDEQLNKLKWIDL